MSRSSNTKNRTKSENKSIMENNHTANHGFSMLPFTWVVVFFVLGFYIAQAQDAVKQHSDSLLNNARKAPTTELKIEALLNVSIFWIDYDTAKAHQYLAEARRLMDKPPTDYQKGLYHLYHANILMDFEPQKAKAAFSTADSLLARSETTKSYRVRNSWKSLSTNPFLMRV